MPNPAEALADFLLAVLDHLAKRARQAHDPATSITPEPPMSADTPSDAPAAHPLTAPSPATLIYKCSRCDTVFPAYPLADGPGMWRAILTACNQLAPGGPAKLPMAIEHVCGDGKRGAGYVVGMDDATAG